MIITIVYVGVAIDYPHLKSFQCLFFTFTPDCPSIALPSSPDILSCQPTQSCTGVKCCVAIDIKVTQLFLDAWLIIDHCNLGFSVGLGAWMFEGSLIDFNWSTERTHEVNSALVIK